MRFVDEFRDPALAQAIARNIRRAVRPGRRYRLMEFCGGHTHAISRFGIADLLPEGVRMIHGPGCPVCVLPLGRIDSAIDLAARRGVTLCTYADTLRVPASRGISLASARAGGADIRAVISAADALSIAREQPDREVVFFAIGFETTAPATAVVLREAARLALTNFSVFCNHVITPAAIASILESPQVRAIDRVEVDGFIGPAHVSCVIGTQPYEYFAEEYRRPVVIAGFEPLDVMQAVLMLVTQLNEGRHEVQNEYSRAVTREGNERAKALVAETFELRRRFEWRGLGVLPYSALRIRPAFRAFDAEVRYRIAERSVADHPACECGAILRGARRPTDCRAFGTACTPERPLGACMVSGEGACAAWYRSAGHRRSAAG